MDASSVHQHCKTERSSSPKQLTSELNHDFDTKGGCATPEQKHETAENVQKESAEARIGDSTSVSFKQLRSPEDSTKDANYESLPPDVNCELLPQDATCSLEKVEFVAENVTRKVSSPEQIMMDLEPEFGSETVRNGLLKRNQVYATEYAQNGPIEKQKVECECISTEQVGGLLEEASGNTSLESLKPPVEDETSKISLDLETKEFNIIELRPQLDAMSRNPGLEQSQPAHENEAKNPNQLEGKEKKGRGRPRREEISLTSSVGSTQVLRSNTRIYSVGSTRSLRPRSREKSKAPDGPDPSNDVTEEGAGREKKRRKKKKQMQKLPVNEFSRIRTHLRYLLNRINYEQNFIDAYSGEGWKGQSLDKIKPEKEIQRAKSEILRRKLKIRDLFQRLDMSCAEGRLPEALFDSEGEIDSEDIFCAKCGSKDLSLNNDIILCDGACERGFHQFCLEPPLLKEDIPPDDEGWLCPGCDCKVDCIDLLNDSQGTNLSVSDSWEKVFPEAAASAAGNKLDDNLGLPSDDSEDDDYDPDGPQLDEEVQGDESSSDKSSSDESSSDESDYYSASDDLGSLHNNEQYFGLPSDDSEDEDYDPNVVKLDQEQKEESSSSDFTSDSEDFSVAFDEPSGEQCEMKRQSMGNELLSLLDEDLGQGDSAPVSARRQVERLDYKKLHDETYGSVSSDSSDEEYMGTGNKSFYSSGEEFVDGAAPKRRKSNTRKAASVSPNRATSTVKLLKNPKILDGGGRGSSPASLPRVSSEPGSSGKSTPKSAYKRLGEAVTQRLFASFKENQYPDRDVKEKLANELALTVYQVDKWFQNARWSSRHLSHKESSHQQSVKLSKSEPESKLINKDATSIGVEKKGQPKASHAGTKCSGDVKSREEGNEQNSGLPKSRKRKVKSENESTKSSTSKKTQKHSVEVNLLKSHHEVRKSSRIQSRNTKSIS